MNDLNRNPSKRQHFPPPPPPLLTRQPSSHDESLHQQSNPCQPTASSKPSQSSFNPYLVEGSLRHAAQELTETSVSPQSRETYFSHPLSAALPTSNQTVSAYGTTSSINVNEDTRSKTVSQYPNYPMYYSNSQNPYPQKQSTVDTAQKMIGIDTLKPRNIGQKYSLSLETHSISGRQSYVPDIKATNSGKSYMIGAKVSSCNNNGGIALILIPPLLFLFFYEMTSSFPLIVFLFLCLIVYALDLANPGGNHSVGGGKGNYLQRGFYTLSAIWIGFIVLSIVVGYDTLVLGDVTSGMSSVMITSNEENGPFEGGPGNLSEKSYNLKSFGSMIWMAVLTVQWAISTMLLFCLATWTTLQFEWLPYQLPKLARLLERILHLSLPPVSASIVAYGLTISSLSSPYVSWGIDCAALLLPHLFALLLSLGIWLVGAAPSILTSIVNTENQRSYKDKTEKNDNASLFSCAIYPGDGKILSHLLVYAPIVTHLVTFRQRIAYSYASWDDLFDFGLTVTVPYLLHYLLASNGVFDEQWRRSLNWFLKAGTSPVEGGKTLRGAAVPMAMSLLASISFQQRYLLPLCARVSYIVNGHEGIISTASATTFLSLGTILLYVTVWFIGRQKSDGSYLMGEYHEDVFQVLLGGSAVFFGLSFSPPWSFLPIPILFAESIALWLITKQLRYATLTIFIFFTCGTLLITYRLTFLQETVEILPKIRVSLKSFAQCAMSASLWLIFLVGLVHRAPGGVGAQYMKKWDFTGVCLTLYSLFLVALEFSLLRCPMPLYSRDNFEVGRVAVYSPTTSYFTGFLTLIVTWHLKRQKVIKGLSMIMTSSVAIGKTIAVVIEENKSDGALEMYYIRWLLATLLLITILIPWTFNPVHIKMSANTKRNIGPSGKPKNQLPKYAVSIVIFYCAVALPLVIILSVRMVLEPFVGLLTGYNDASFSIKTSALSEVIGYSTALWGLVVLQMINHFLPDGGAEVIRKLSGAIFVMGIFFSFSAPAIPWSTQKTEDSQFLKVSSLYADNSTNSGGWGLVAAFLAIMLSLTGPLELREIRDASGRRDTRQLLRLMIFGILFGCGLSWFITLQSMSKDVFIPIFVTTFSCMAMSFLGTIASVMGYFLETRDFVEAEQIANVWVGVGFPLFFVISSISLSADAHPFGIGGWASTYLSVCGLLASAFSIMIRLRREKNSSTRGYGNMSCVLSWLCAISVVYGRYGVACVGVVGTRYVAGIPMSVVGTFLCSPILALLEGEPSDPNKDKYQISSSKSKRRKGLIFPSLMRSNWFTPLLAGTLIIFLMVTVYAIFLRGFGLSKVSYLFGTGEIIKIQEDLFLQVYGTMHRKNKGGSLDDIEKLARKSIVHSRSIVVAARLSGSGLWTSKSVFGPVAHLVGLFLILPSLYYLVAHSWKGHPPSFGKAVLFLPLNILAIIIGRGIPALVAAAAVGLIGGLIQIVLL